MNPATIALAVSVAINAWLAVTRIAARRTAIDADGQLYRTARAAVHLVNGTVSGDPAVVDEMSEIRFCAYCETQASDRPLYQLTDAEQIAIRVAARRRLVLEGHMTLDHAHRSNRYELDADAAGAERTQTEALLVASAT